MHVSEAAIGDTPLLELDLGTPGTVYGKAEWFNLPNLPHGGGSVKDRIAVAMLDSLDADPGEKPVLEPSSGNTGAALARVGEARGYDVEIVMPAAAATGKKDAVREAGGTVHGIETGGDYDVMLDACEGLAADGDYARPGQYENPANPGAHERTTAVEIVAGAEELTHFVAGVGTGGTVTGVGRGLPDSVETVGYEPAEEDHGLEGLKYLRGDGLHPDTYDESVLDSKRYVTTEAGYAAARGLCETYADREVRIADPGRLSEAEIRGNLRVDGDLLVGPSSGGALALARELAADPDAAVVALLADRGDRYPDAELWAERL
jgi:cysteine synthase